MTLPEPVRYLLVAIVVAGSFVPQLITTPMLGEINLWFLAMLWLVLFLCFYKASSGAAKAVVVLGAIAMAIPPVPNYLWISETQGPHFQFVGLDNLLSGLYGILFFFVFYLAAFGSAAWLVRKRATALKAG